MSLAVILLIAEIILTINAWNRGWKWLALIPGGICLVIGFIINLTNSGGSFNPLDWIGIEILAIIVLVIMCIIGRKPSDKLPALV